MVTLGMIFLFAFAFLALEGLGTRYQSEPYHFARKPAVCFMLVFLTVFLAPMQESQFIYFNF
jgi:hypothetical protein